MDKKVEVVTGSLLSYPNPTHPGEQFEVLQFTSSENGTFCICSDEKGSIYSLNIRDIKIVK